MARMRDYYVKDVAPALMKKFSYKSVMQIPKLEKIVVNVGCGEARDNPKMIDAIISDLSKITGQKAVPCKAKKYCETSSVPTVFYLSLFIFSSAREAAAIRPALSSYTDPRNPIRGQDAVPLHSETESQGESTRPDPSAPHPG